MSTAAGSARQQEALSHQLAQALSQPLKMPRLSIVYHLGLLLTACFVVVLPVIYLALITLVGWFVYRYAVTAPGVIFSVNFRGRGVVLLLFAYLAPLLMGLMLVGFMLKPLIAPREPREVGPTLDPQAEPLLHELVQRICQAVGAPVPRRIDVISEVNALASWRRGWMSFFFGGDLVLTLGLPLLAGLSIRDLSCVIAHEFGHFRQGVAMRMTFLIGRVNGWFARVVYQRDGWDVALLDGCYNSESLWISIFCWLMRLLVWLTRRVLWVLMVVSHGVSQFMARQMEYDADRVAAAVAGGDCIGPVLVRIAMLDIMAGNALENMAQHAGERNLYDDLPSYIATSMGLLTVQQRQHITEQIMKQRTGLFDTHPSIASRDARARKLKQPGILTAAQPAKLLLREYQRLCQVTTYAFYSSRLGDKLRAFTLVSTEPFVAKLQVRSTQTQAVDRYLEGAFNKLHPPLVSIKQLQKPRDLKAAVARLAELRQRIKQQAPQVRQWLSQVAEQSSEWCQQSMRVRLLEAQVELQDLKPSDAGKVRAKVLKAQEQLQHLQHCLAEFDALVQERLGLVFGLLFTSAVQARLPQAQADQDAVKRLVPLLNRTSAHYLAAESFTRTLGLAESLGAVLEQMPRSTRLQNAMLQVRAEARSLGEQLQPVLEKLNAAAAPKPTANTPADPQASTDDAYDLAQPLPTTKTAQVDGHAVTDMMDLHIRLLSDLFAIAERVETAVGFKSGAATTQAASV